MFSLQTGDTKHKIFKQAIANHSGKINKAAISSFLCGNRFVAANFLDDLLSISVYDYETEKLLNVFTQKNETENTGFINGPVFNATGKPVLKNDEKGTTPAATKKFSNR